MGLKVLMYGEISDPAITGWILASFNKEFDHIGHGDSFNFIGTNLAYASTGGLQWWKWFIGDGGVRVPLVIVPPKNQEFVPGIANKQ